MNRPILVQAVDSKPAKPNILFVFSDQQHWQAVGYRDRFFDTPNLDRVAKESFIFDHAFCATPQCSPSRSTPDDRVLSPHTTGILSTIGCPGGNELEMPTIGSFSQKAGYYTGYCGK